MRRPLLAVLVAFLALSAAPSRARASEQDESFRPLRVDLRPLYGPQLPRGRRAEDSERIRPRGRFRPTFVFLAAPVPPPALSQAEPVRPARGIDERKSPARHKAATPPALLPAL